MQQTDGDNVIYYCIFIYIMSGGYFFCFLVEIFENIFFTKRVSEGTFKCGFQLLFIPTSLTVVTCSQKLEFLIWFNKKIQTKLVAVHSKWCLR